MSENKPNRGQNNHNNSNKNNKRRHNNRNKNRNNSNNNNGISASKSGNSNNKRNFSKNRRPKSLTPAKILQKYDNLMEQYLNARRKYFDCYGRNSDRNLTKALSNYDQALFNLRDFENKLQDWQKEVLERKVDNYKPDREYSTNHDLRPEGDIVSFVGEFEDPHLLETQKAHSWSSDTEESTGTMEDYEKYKSSQL